MQYCRSNVLDSSLIFPGKGRVHCVRGGGESIPTIEEIPPYLSDFDQDYPVDYDFYLQFTCCCLISPLLRGSNCSNRSLWVQDYICNSDIATPKLHIPALGMTLVIPCPTRSVKYVPDLQVQLCLQIPSLNDRVFIVQVWGVVAQW